MEELGRRIAELTQERRFFADSKWT